MQLITAGSGVLVKSSERAVPAAPHAPRDPWQLLVKHAAGRTFAAVMLLVLLPALVAIAVAVKLSSPGKVLYRQRRVGRHGQTFEILKFRSMSDAPAAAFVPAAGSAPGGVEGEDRRTWVGTLLRRTSLDELPQLFNVLRGDMCLVGPRPERPEFVERFEVEIPAYAVRHHLRVGMTGLAQVRGLRGKTSIVDRAAADAEYVENWSIALDIKILLRTFGAVLQAAE